MMEREKWILRNRVHGGKCQKDGRKVKERKKREFNKSLKQNKGRGESQ